MDNHLNPLDVAEFIEGFLDEGRTGDAIEHLADCGKCAGFLADVLRALSGDPTRSPPIQKDPTLASLTRVLPVLCSVVLAWTQLWHRRTVWVAGVALLVP